MHHQLNRGFLFVCTSYADTQKNVCGAFTFFKIIFKNVCIICNNIIYLARLSKYIIKITLQYISCNEMVGKHS